MFEREFEAHLIKKNHARAMPQRMLFFDSETKQREVKGEVHHRMNMAWSCYWERRPGRDNDTVIWQFWESTYKLNRYIDRLARKKTRLWIFGHNVFFDLQACDYFHYFTKWGWVLNFWYDASMTYILSISKEKRKVTCLSTTNYFPFSLADLGALLNLPKQEIDLATADFETMKDYCRRDVEIIKAAIEYYLKFIGDNDLGAFKMTRASQAMAAYRHRFMHRRILVHRDKEVSDFERKAYHGGRVECFRLGKIEGGPFLSLDVNSLYPYVMRTRSYPVKLLACYEYPSMDLLKDALKSRCVVAHCRIKTDEPAYAVVKDNKVIFPVGTFSAYLCTEGVRYALDRDHLHDIEKISIYEKGHIFTDYVDYINALKVEYAKQDNKIMRSLSKYMGLSLYGKFAQKAPVTEEFEDITFDGYYREEILDAVTGKTEILTKLFNKQIITFDEVTGKNSFIAISAHVAEYGRFHLWKIIKGLGRDKALYCDTDSVKIRKQDLKYIRTGLDPFTLGALKVEDESDTLILHGPKDYETEKSVTIKGVPRHAVKVEEGRYRYTHFPRQDTHLRKQITRFFITTPMEKKLERKYTKGKVLKDGRVIPITLNEALPPSLLFGAF